MESRPRLRLFGRIIAAVLLLILLLLVAEFSYNYIVTPDVQAAPLGARLLLAGLFLAGPFWAFLTRISPARRAFAPWLALAVSLSCFLAWLTIDDREITHDLDHPALRADFPEAAATYALTLRYTKDEPGSLHATFTPSELHLPSSGEKPGQHAKWLAAVIQNRAKIETRWEELQPLREWIEEMAAQPRIGDLTEDLTDPIIASAPLREIPRFAIARAELLALDGQRDEAIALLIPLIAAGQKLEPQARTLVRRMIAIIMQRQALEAVEGILDRGSISEAMRIRFSTTIGAALQDPTEGARLIFLCEYAPLCRYIAGPGVPFLLFGSEDKSILGASYIWKLVYNPRSTANNYGEWLHSFADASTARDAAASAALGQRFLTVGRRPLRKNIGGHFLIQRAMSAFDKVEQRYWELQNLRATLLARLAPFASEATPSP